MAERGVRTQADGPWGHGVRAASRQQCELQREGLTSREEERLTSREDTGAPG